MTSALAIKGLRKVYEGGFEALKGIDLEVQQGDFFALLGPNGAGKSTTLGIVSSLVNKSSGQVTVFGRDLDLDSQEVKRSLGVVPQEFNFNFFEKVQDIVLNQAGYYGLPRKLAKERCEFYLKKLDLWEKRNEPARFLSGGMKRRLMIARALIHEPKLLILDEPTAGVDIEIRRSMWDFLTQLNQQGTTIILTTHYLEEAESLCRHTAIISKGEIIANMATKELIKQVDKATFVVDVEQVLGQDLQLSGIPVTRVDEHTLEFEINKNQGLNEVMSAITQAQLTMVSIRPKTNRLEELFVDMVSQKGTNHASK